MKYKTILGIDTEIKPIPLIQDTWFAQMRKVIEVYAKLSIEEKKEGWSNKMLDLQANGRSEFKKLCEVVGMDKSAFAEADITNVLIIMQTGELPPDLTAAEGEKLP